ncbi:MAG: hypothetical protein RQ745_05625 [Longimicrobiales bacterium]|nr:hypothetical protein [Longimicrobiales bacterium]
MTPTDDTRTAERANALYWSSDHSVNDLADELDLSKGALYGLLRPHPAGLTCPECGGGMEYPNRTAKEKGLVTCHSCGMEEEEALVRAEAAEDAYAVAATHEEDAAATDPPSDGGSHRIGHSGIGYPARVVVGAALLGTATGYLVARLTRRSR